MINIGVLQAVLRLKDQMTPGLKRAQTSLRKTSARLDRVGRSLIRNVTLPLAAAGGAAIKFAIDLNRSMANVATLIPNSTERVLELKTSVQDLAEATGKSSKDLSQGLYQVISAFGDTADTAKILELNALAASAGLATTTEAIALTSAVTKGYGDTSFEAMQKASDLAFTTVKLGQTSFPELAGAIGRVAISASGLKITQEELNAVFATMTGVTGKAAEVSTQFRGAMTGLKKPSEDMKVALKGIGFETGEAALASLGFQGTLQALMTQTGGNAAEMAKLFESTESWDLIQGIASVNAEKFTSNLLEMEDAAGATTQAFKDQTEGINKAGFEWEQMRRSMDRALEDMGQELLPLFTEIVGVLKDDLIPTIKDLAAGFNSLDEDTKNTVIKLLGFVAAAGPVAYGASKVTKSVWGTVGALGAFSAWYVSDSPRVTKFFKDLADSWADTKGIEHFASAQAILIKALRTTWREWDEVAQESIDNIIAHLEDLSLLEEAISAGIYPGPPLSAMKASLELLEKHAEAQKALIKQQEKANAIQDKARAVLEKAKKVQREFIQGIRDEAEALLRQGIPAGERAVAVVQEWNELHKVSTEALREQMESIGKMIEAYNRLEEAVPVEAMSTWMDLQTELNKRGKLFDPIPQVAIDKAISHLRKLPPEILEIPEATEEAESLVQKHIGGLNAIFKAAFEGGGGAAGAVKSFATGVLADLLKMIPVVGETLSKFSGAFVAFGEKLFGMGGKGAIAKQLEGHQKAVEVATAAREKLQQVEADAAQALQDLQSNWRGAEEAAGRYNIGLNALGDIYKAAKWSEDTQQLADDWELLALHGKNLNTIAEKMAPTVQEMIDKYQKAGIDIPDHMKPIIDKQIEMGLLTDAEGNALESMAALDFATPIEKQMGDLVTAIDGLVTVLTDKLMPQFDAINTYQFDPKTISVNTEYGRIAAGMDLPQGNAGTGGRYVDFGSGSPVMLHGKERIMTEAEGASDTAILLGIRRDLKTLPLMIRDAVILSS